MIQTTTMRKTKRAKQREQQKKYVAKLECLVSHNRRAQNRCVCKRVSDESKEKYKNWRESAKEQSDVPFSHRKLCAAPDYGMRRNGDRKREVESGRASENKHANTYTPSTVRLSRNANVMMCI